MRPKHVVVVVGVLLVGLVTGDRSERAFLVEAGGRPECFLFALAGGHSGQSGSLTY
jgi:hypothetical protein